MGDLATKYLIDGIDRLGKSTLALRIQHELGYFLSIHYGKPVLLDNTLAIAKMMKQESPDTPEMAKLLELSNENLAKRLYYEDMNSSMFELLKTNQNLIIDRTHLCEMVYAPMYRNYTGDYIYTMEKQAIEDGLNLDDVRLILLVTSDTSILIDDGESYDFSKKDQEQTLFREAFNRSQFTNKIVINVCNGQGGFRTPESIVKEALYKNTSLPTPVALDKI